MKRKNDFFCLFIVNITKRNCVSSHKKIASWRFFLKQLLTCYIQQQNRKRTFHKSSIFSNCDFFTWPTSECGDSHVKPTKVQCVGRLSAKIVLFFWIYISENNSNTISRARKKQLTSIFPIVGAAVLFIVRGAAGRGLPHCVGRGQGLRRIAVLDLVHALLLEGRCVGRQYQTQSGSYTLCFRKATISIWIVSVLPSYQFVLKT